MSKLNVIRTSASDYLSVSHKSLNSGRNPLIKQKDCLVIQTDLQFNISSWNDAAEQIYGQPGAKNKNIFQIIEIDFLDGNQEELLLALSEMGTWNGEIIFNGYNRQKYFFETTAVYIKDGKGIPVSVMFICNSLQEEKIIEKQIDVAKKKYEILMHTLPQGVMMISGSGVIESCNKRCAEMLGISANEVLGMLYTTHAWNVVKPDGSIFPFTEFPGNVSLQTGFPQRNVIMGIIHTDESIVWVSVNSVALLQPEEFEPYAVVITFSDITEAKKIEEELRKSNERFYHVSKISTDAIWDMDLTSNKIYRSGAFRRLSGYSPEQIDNNLNWWFTKVHPGDKERVKKKLDMHMQQGLERWDDEYRFECADGTFKFLHDSGVILYKSGMPVRMLGAIRDLTGQKKLEKQLLDEQEQRHKDISEAALAAQEMEKAYISKELHDNVNQILMSGKLYIETAKRMPGQCDELLDKAVEYQLLALQEIRKLSKSLSTSNVKTVGLRESVDDIVKNMKLLQLLDVDFIFNNKLEEILTDDQKLMIFRIVQEQTNNICKYANAKSVLIMINLSNDMIQLVITDDGIGFDTSNTSSKGIGFVNIISRADVYNGKVNIISSPGNGCTLEICCPIH